MSRGVLYLAWGTKCREELKRSQHSVDRFDLAHHAVEGSVSHALGQKTGIYDASPFDLTLFLDTDTVLLDDPSFGFEMAERYGLCVVIAPASNATLHFQIEGAPADLVQYNTGVIFFKKGDRVRALFEAWSRYCPPAEPNDQPGFARAVYETGFNPFVLPLAWNYRAEYGQGPIFGPIKVWHSRRPLPKNIHQYNQDARGFADLQRRRWWRSSRIRTRS